MLRRGTGSLATDPTADPGEVRWGGRPRGGAGSPLGVRQNPVTKPVPSSPQLLCNNPPGRIGFC